VHFRRGWLLLVASALIAGACDTGDTAETTDSGFIWSRVVHDEAVFGGARHQAMLGVTAGGSGLVAVGTDLSATIPMRRCGPLLMGSPGHGFLTTRRCSAGRYSK